MQLQSDSPHLLWRYFLVSYAAVLLNGLGYLGEIRFVGAMTPFFVVATLLTYSTIYLLPIFGVLVLFRRFVFARHFDAWFADRATLRRGLVYAVSVLGLTLVQLGLFTDRSVYKIFGFHLNGFVWNLVSTKGGIESMGGGPGTTFAFVLIAIGFLALQGGLLFAVVRAQRIRPVLDRLSSRRAITTLASLFIGASLFGQLTYGICSLRGYGPVLAASNAFPLYFPTTFYHLAKRMGLDVKREPMLRVDVDSLHVRYPLEPIRRRPVGHPLNIVWLTSESLRSDMLDPEIMPHAHAFALQANWFRHHYSGGNGTRMGMFSMFYGLYGSYWFPFLHERRGPLLIDTLIDQNYQMEMFTGAKFSYPEFDKTIFTRIPSDRLHQGGDAMPWRRDVANISGLINFIDQRDTSRPFMTFLFFEAPHAKYTFPDSAVIREPYMERVNYATMNVERDIGLMKNRYINACHFIDAQIARVLNYLGEHDLLDSTIVLLTGDHGEEFMEHGRWGHNSTFVDEQTLVPLVLWIPGTPARQVTHMTSHLDIAATLLPRLGVTNPTKDYCQGFDLLGPEQRSYAVLADWNDLVFVDANFKAVFPINAFSFGRQIITTSDDREVEDRAAFYQDHQAVMLEMMKGMKTFSQ